MSDTVERYPDDRRYHTEHEWVKPVGEREALIGISWYAQDALGDIVYVSLPEVGAELAAGQPFGEIESVKSVSEIYSPVDGRVLEVNEEVANSPEVLNEDPYDRGWLVRVALDAPSQLDELMDAATYQGFVSGSVS